MSPFPYGDSVREEVDAIRERIAAGDNAPDRLRKVLNKCALGLFDGIPAPSPDWEEIELIARLAADVAGLLHQKQWPECSICRRRHGPEERHEAE